MKPRIILAMVVMSLVYAGAAYPDGMAVDRGKGPQLLAGGLLALIAADLVLARAAGPVLVLLGSALWGLHMGMTQGLLAALVAKSSPVDLRGTAFGVFNLVSGIALLIASVVAGWLWDRYGPAMTFQVAAGLTVAAAVGLWVRRSEVGALAG